MDLSVEGNAAAIHLAMDLLLDLLAQLDRGSDEIIFFADEGGSWQVGIDVDKVLPAYFTSLAAVAEPEEYARKVSKVIKEHGSYASEKLLEAARKAENELQRQALAKR